MKNIKWETTISISALLISILSFLYTLQIERSKSSPNVQVQSVNGGRTAQVGDSSKNVSIISTIVLINVGNAPTQIVDVRWELAATSDAAIDGLFGISDTWSPSDAKTKEYFESIRNSPIEGIKQTTLRPSKPLTLNLLFESGPVPIDDTTLQNIRITFIFSNGQQLTVLPELKYFGGSIKF